jgi:isoaspartyl peptidase/L-asparaginase-like protein (Ntn-hydrolase superfamily)
MSEKCTRREFFRTTALGTAVTLAPSLAGLALDRVGSGQAPKAAAGLDPIIVSTWRWGKPANEKAGEVLMAGGSLVDAVEKGINTAELDPDVMTVGYGSYPNENGEIELDALVIDGPTHGMGAVAALHHIKTPISVARRVMEKTKHTMLAGEGALQFAIREGFPLEELHTEKSIKAYLEWKAKPDRARFWREAAHDTISLVVFDGQGNFAGGNSTSGLPWKVAGRVGDSPIPGSGLYVDNDVGGAGATGNGDEMLRFCITFLAVELMRAGMHPQKACEAALERMLKKNRDYYKNVDANVFAINRKGEIGAMGMRPGRFKYAVWTKTSSELKDAGSMV